MYIGIFNILSRYFFLVVSTVYSLRTHRLRYALSEKFFLLRTRQILMFAKIILPGNTTNSQMNHDLTRSECFLAFCTKYCPVIHKSAKVCWANGFWLKNVYFLPSSHLQYVSTCLITTQTLALLLMTGQYFVQKAKKHSDRVKSWCIWGSVVFPGRLCEHKYLSSSQSKNFSLSA